MTDDRSARLFSAARVERPNGEVRDRTLSAMLELAHAPESEVRPEPSLRRPLAVAIAAVAIAAAFAVLVRRHDAPVNDGTLVAETIAPTPPSASLVASASPPVSVPSPPEVHSAPPAAGRPRPSLADEARALERIRRAIASGSTPEALKLLERYERGGAENRMSAEATLLRIEALARSERAAEARRLANDFVAANPGNPLSDRARAILTTLDRPSDAGAPP